MIVPFPPGGPTDYVARLVAQLLSVSLGQVVIDNRAGAGGTIAAKAVAGAPPDGYTLLYGSSATLGIAPALYKNVDYDPIKSFAPVALVSRVPFVLGISSTLPAQTLAEFIFHAKNNPGKLNFGAGIGTPPHLVGELFKVTTGTDILYVPYKGAAQAMTDLLAGQMHMTIEGATTLLAHIQSGKVRALAVMSPQRLPALPDVPTMTESGYAGFPPASWTGVLAPADTPAAVVGKLNVAINDARSVRRDQDQFRQVQRRGEGRLAGGFRSLHRSRSSEMGGIGQGLGRQGGLIGTGGAWICAGAAFSSAGARAPDGNRLQPGV